MEEKKKMKQAGMLSSIKKKTQKNFLILPQNLTWYEEQSTKKCSITKFGKPQQDQPKFIV